MGHGVVRLQRPGRPELYLGALSQRVKVAGEQKSKAEHRAAVYTFEAVPPFRILGVGEVIPLEDNSTQDLEVRLTTDSSDDSGTLLLGYGPVGEDHHLQRVALERAVHLPREPTRPIGLTLVMMSYSRKRFDDLIAILRKYRRMPRSVLEEIVIIWNTPTDSTAADEIRALNAESEGVTLRVIDAQVNSMNNRFAIWEAISTDGVIIQDDDMWLETADLARLVDVWRSAPTELVGAFAERDHFVVEDGKLVELSPTCEEPSGPEDTVMRCNFWGEEFSQLLPHPWIVAKDYLRRYMENEPLTKLVDDLINCDDIYFNAVVANATRRPPIAVDVPVHRFPRWADDSSLWASDSSWMDHRTQCLEEVNKFYMAKSNVVLPELGHAPPYSGTVWRLAPGATRRM